jgi:hypothetical protein
MAVEFLSAGNFVWAQESIILLLRGNGKSFNTDNAEKNWRATETAAWTYCSSSSLQRWAIFNCALLS